MTRKTYKSAMGKIVDLGALMLENENVRAVGNMNVNARGDMLDSTNKVIDSKNKQVQRQYRRQTTVAAIPPTGSTRLAKEAQLKANNPVEKIIEDVLLEDATEPTDSAELTTTTPRGGLAAAIAKSQAVKQELLKTPRQLAREQAGVKKL
jgi:hypothetical protein